MSFRRRLLLACAAAVAVAVALAATLAYAVTRNVLRGQIDDSLRHTAAQLATAPPGNAVIAVGGKPDAQSLSTSALEGPAVFTQVFEGGPPGPRPPDGRPVQLVDRAELNAVATGRQAAFFTEREALGQEQRVYVAPTATGGAVVVARPLTEVQATLGRLRIGLGVVLLAGIAAALAFGRLATRAAVKPVVELTEAAEHVARTRDLSRRIERSGNDELSRLAASFDTMLEALAASQLAQRQLVADASHELRTPLTSLRTNIEVLDAGGLDAADRARLRADVVAQLEELTGLVADLVDLARDEEPADEREPVRLDELVAAAVCRAARHAPAIEFRTDVEPAVVTGVPARLDRAVANLLDNAAKFSPPGGTVDVRLRDGELIVRDRGPGIAAEDLPFVFDRFYRAPAARGQPGSGLGLAIVRRVAEAHGGAASAAPAPGGGTVLSLRLPLASLPALSAIS
jgi:two-component system, OmpR family, sensor histidine kinase MprB